MNQNFIIPIIIFLSFTGCKPNNKTENQQNYQDTTRQLVREGKYQEALGRHIWYHDHILERDTNQKGVRRSFALYDWMQLGALYPPAIDSMIQIRNRKTTEVLSTGQSKELFADVVAFNRNLKQNHKSVELFDSICSKYPALANQSCWYVFDDILNEKRFDLIKKSTASAAYLHEKSIDHYKRTVDFEYADDDLRKIANNLFISRSLALIDYCKREGDPKTAMQIKQNSMALLKDPRLEAVKI